MFSFYVNRNRFFDKSLKIKSRIILAQCCYPFVSLISTLRPQLFQVSLIGIVISTVSGTLAFIYIFITG